MKQVNCVIDINAHIQDLKCNIRIENGLPVAHIGFQNLGYGVITAIKFKAMAFNENGDTELIDGKEKFYLIIQDIHVEENQASCSIQVTLPNPAVKKLTLEEGQIYLADSTVLTYPGKHDVSFELLEFDPENDAEQEQLQALKLKYGIDFIYKPAAFDVGWICGCGQFNKPEFDTCMCCHLPKAEILNSCTKDQLDAAVNTFRLAKKQHAKQYMTSLDESNENDYAVVYGSQTPQEPAVPPSAPPSGLKKPLKTALLAAAAAVVILAAALGYNEVQKKQLKEDLQKEWMALADSIIKVLEFSDDRVEYRLETGYAWLDMTVDTFDYKVVTGSKIKIKQNGLKYTTYTIEFSKDKSRMTITPAVTTVDSSEVWYNLD